MSNNTTGFNKEPLNKELLSDSIYKAIREKIIEGDFAPGEHIVELEIARAFSTSQAPVREAFRQLQREGLVVSIPYKGSFICEVHDDEVNEIYRLRYSIEKIATEEMLKRWNEKHSQALHAILANMTKSVKNNLLADLVEADLSFHRYICRNSSDYENIINIWEILVGKTCLAIANFDKGLVERGNIDVTLNHHKDMVKAFDSADKGKLMQSFENHWSLIFGLEHQ
jgi:Transcriptional regulators